VGAASSRDSLSFSLALSPSRFFPSGNPSETRQEALKVSEQLPDGKNRDTVVAPGQTGSDGKSNSVRRLTSVDSTIFLMTVRPHIPSVADPRCVEGFFFGYLSETFSASWRVSEG